MSGAAQNAKPARATAAEADVRAAGGGPDEPLRAGPAGGHAGHEQPRRSRAQAGPGPVPRSSASAAEDHAELDADRQQEGDPSAEHRAGRGPRGPARTGHRVVGVGGAWMRGEEHDRGEEQQVAHAPVAEDDDPRRDGGGPATAAALLSALASPIAAGCGRRAGRPGRPRRARRSRSQAEQRRRHRRRPPAEQSRGAGADEAERHPAEGDPADRATSRGPITPMQSRPTAKSVG